MDVVPLWDDVFMDVSALLRVREGLAELIGFVNDPATPTSDLRLVLGECKGFGGQLAVLQADAAAGVAARERHGDSGAGVLAQAAGLSRRDAASQVKTVEGLQEVSGAREALVSGEISVANAKTLVSVCERTSAQQVAGDGELLAQAAALSAGQFAREAGRWAARRQIDGGEGLYRRQRARRRLSFWDGDDGMVHLRGELDPVTGAKVRKRFSHESERLRRLDLHSPGGDKRSLNQRMADTLDTLTSHGSVYSRADAGNQTRTGPSRTSRDSSGVSRAAVARLDGPDGRASTVNGEASESHGGSGGAGRCGCGGRPWADITIVQHLSADGTEAFAEIAGGPSIPPSVLEEHFCNARIKGVVFSADGMPLWHGHAKRRATKAQMSALRARYGACGGCGADMWICDGHHIEAVSQGGRTDIDNLMLLCWICHQKVHHHQWRVVADGRGLYTIAPPERIRHGPARAPDPPPANGPPARARPGRRQTEPVGPFRGSGDASHAGSPEMASQIEPVGPLRGGADRPGHGTNTGPGGCSSGHTEPLFTVD